MCVMFFYHLNVCVYNGTLTKNVFKRVEKSVLSSLNSTFLIGSFLVFFSLLLFNKTHFSKNLLITEILMK